MNNNVTNAEEARSIADDANIRQNLKSVMHLINDAASSGEYSCHINNMSSAMAQYLEKSLHYKVKFSEDLDDSADVSW